MNDVVVLFPSHSRDCPVCGGAGRVRWCAVRVGADGDAVADRLGALTPCVPLPRLADLPAPPTTDGAA